MVKINDMYYVQVEDKNLTLQKVVGTDKRPVKQSTTLSDITLIGRHCLTRL